MIGMLGGGIGPIGGPGSDEEGKIPLEALFGLGIRGLATSAQQGKLPIMGLMQDPQSFMPQANKGPSPSAPASTNPMDNLSPEQFQKLKDLLNSQQPK